MRILSLLAALSLAIASAEAQTDQSPAQAVGGLFWGPRFGATFLSKPVTDELERKNIETAAIISQVGWSWEQRFVVSPQSPMAMTQFVVLVGGAEQSVFLPSLTWLIGVRGIGGAEAGFGPNVSLAGISMAFAFGLTSRVGALNVPFDIAVVVGKPGVRISLLTGFNMRKDGTNQLSSGTSALGSRMRRIQTTNSF